MTDRELLELAAKAAGIKLDWTDWPTLSPRRLPEWDAWNPLFYDGDALRLAVNLKMTILTRLFGDCAVGCQIPPRNEPVIVGVEDERDTAVRRAIVLAAAKIAQATPQERQI